MAIHPTVIIEGELVAPDDVQIGPYTVIRGKVKLGHRCRIDPHVTLGSQFSVIEMGDDNHVCSGAVLGGPPQDLSYKNESTSLIIGSRNVFREFVTVNIGTKKGGGVTRIGNDGYFMNIVHIGHDVQIGDRVVIAADCHLGGHTIIEDDVTIGGVSAFNQFVRVGKGAFIGGGSIVVKDILPFSKALGNHAICRASNKIGMQRKGYSAQEIESVHRAIRIILMGSETIGEAIERIKKECEMTPSVAHIISFIQESKRGIAK
ncbi:MAG: acyl-ACP--UDP-N-acetylglucosamine O-acyltransferase [Bdellovibrionaceae bacterium]|nr:acyl-ACP--UDP-N-acetylglucosamine O-acyltransferase [Pseudobdellovibrionaceae bacterium]MDW8189680.1 acyl-ACP--UDP-N-acetylglucosamine O-acyltransferase [Pseudobdellovibrionaceae bacterium]